MVDPGSMKMVATVSLQLIFIAVLNNLFGAARSSVHGGSFGLCAPPCTAAASSSTPYNPAFSLYSQPCESTPAVCNPIPTGRSRQSPERSPSCGRPPRGGNSSGSHNTRPPPTPGHRPKLSSSSPTLYCSHSSTTAPVTVFVGGAGGVAEVGGGGESGVFGKGDRDARESRESGGGGYPGRLPSLSLRVFAALLAAPIAASCWRGPSAANKSKTKKGCEGPGLIPVSSSVACIGLAFALLGYGKQLCAA